MSIRATYLHPKIMGSERQSLLQHQQAVTPTSIRHLTGVLVLHNSFQLGKSAQWQSQVISMVHCETPQALTAYRRPESGAASAPAARVPVSNRHLKGILVLNKRPWMVKLPDGRKVSPSEFERLAGSLRKNWKSSTHVIQVSGCTPCTPSHGIACQRENRALALCILWDHRKSYQAIRTKSRLLSVSVELWKVQQVLPEGS